MLNLSELLSAVEKAETFITDLKSHNATLLGQVAALTAELTATRGAQDAIDAVQARLTQAASIEGAVATVTTAVQAEVATLTPGGPAQIG